MRTYEVSNCRHNDSYSTPWIPFRLKCMIDVSYGVALLFWTSGGGWMGGLRGVDTGCPNFEFLLGIGSNLGCILKHGWPWGGLGHPTPHLVHPVQPIGDVYYAFAPYFQPSPQLDPSDVSCVHFEHVPRDFDPRGMVALERDFHEHGIRQERIKGQKLLT